ncbi:MAG: glycosyltransferase family 2 protein [Acidobacteria bacterium]|nr:glycosyltransferase family 2 protein [Acidobacteriota bacterium]
MVLEVTFWFFIGLILYTYIGYPIIVFLLSRIFLRPVRKDDFTPSVSVIIAAYNEERDLPEKLENVLSLDYPKDKLEVIVVSDCSTDGTDEIVGRYADRGVILDRQEQRLGKTRAQQQAAKISTGEILVFSDATTIYRSDALKQIVRSFADPEVGCVAGQLIYVDKASTAVGNGCRSYWSYEKYLKQCESRLGSLIGVSGCLYAVRRICQVKLSDQMIDDFVIATEIHLQGLRTVYASEAVSMEDTNKRGRDELRMRIRVISQTLRALNRYREILSVSRHGMFAFQMLSHKVMRYLIPFFLIATIITNWMLMDKSLLYNYLLVGEAIFYLFAFVGWAAEKLKVKIGLLAFPYYFALVNIASIGGIIKFIGGGTQVVWEPMREGRMMKTNNAETLVKPQFAGKGT